MIKFKKIFSKELGKMGSVSGGILGGMIQPLNSKNIWDLNNIDETSISCAKTLSSILIGYKIGYILGYSLGYTIGYGLDTLYSCITNQSELTYRILNNTNRNDDFSDSISPNAPQLNDVIINNINSENNIEPSTNNGNSARQLTI
ncbi:hypothetical protein [Spiroplasma endosymbiont of Amphimallon solstitiale]|uniref:hypothetical protein n=1 Tax=Spiroplasma endosymbiont of Amphimallon solstitiale TaxID=3066288 RepID=UPI00313CE7D0